ncbi:MAG: ATP-dependent helicase [Anaerolineae bacterium]
MNNFTPRPSQQKILEYEGGRLGIAAVPGAGKTHILSALAAKIIQEGHLQEGQEVLIVTLVNSAVDNFEARIKKFFANPLQALYRYRVRTLHGLAHDIVREKPWRVGLEERFTIIEEREASFIRRDAVSAWLAANPYALESYFSADLNESRLDYLRRNDLPDLVDSLALAFIRSAKDRLLTPEELRARLDAFPTPLPLAELGWSIYADYQRALAYRGAVDFDDLIRYALTLLENDAEYRERLRYRYPYILEDEAQDSSETQQKILGLLAGEQGNWVRVGDPNQAIFETFTTANPELLRDFIANNPSVDMPESGRSQPAIIALANHLIEWVMHGHPIREARLALSPPYIKPVPAGDPQQNPPHDPAAIRLIGKKFTPEEELEAVVKSVKGILDSIATLPEKEKPTIAILVPRNQRGIEVIDALRKRGIEPIELVSSTSETRAAAGSLSHVLAYLAQPTSASKLVKAYEVWRRDWRDDPEKHDLLRQATALLHKIEKVEDFVQPAFAPSLNGYGGAALFANEVAELSNDPQPILQELNQFRQYLRRWLEAVTLPIDQLILTLAQDIFTRPSELALAHKLALVLRQAAEDHPDWRLKELKDELIVIAKNERRFIGFSADDTGFDPEHYRGQVVVTTMHKAKGLEWDRVYLMSVNSYDFPANQPGDSFIAEKWYIRNRLNLEAEALEQLNLLLSNGEYSEYIEGQATQRARLDYVKERLRLLYVAITRAKRELIITWNSGRRGEVTPALALAELIGWWQENHSA